MALSLGKKDTNDGVTAGLGITFKLKTKTTTNTKMDTAATNRNINLSVIFLKIQEARIKSQEAYPIHLLFKFYLHQPSRILILNSWFCLIQGLINLTQLLGY